MGKNKDTRLVLDISKNYINSKPKLEKGAFLFGEVLSIREICETIKITFKKFKEKENKDKLFDFPYNEETKLSHEEMRAIPRFKESEAARGCGFVSLDPGP